MAISCRPMRREDIPDCVELLARHPIVGPRYGNGIEELGEVWKRLLRQQSFMGVVFEEGRGRTLRKSGIGVRAFVSDSYLAEIKTAPHFWVGPDIVKRITLGRSPLLTDKQVRDANSRSGLNLYAWEGALSADNMGRPEAIHTLFSEFMNLHRGFRLKEVIAQSTSVDVLEAQLKSGGYLLDASGQYTKGVSAPLKEIVRAPHFVGLTRELALEQYGSWVSSMFIYEAPRFGLRPSEQRLLLSALEGGTDEQIAEKLEISLSAVKKTWRQIYERIAASDPQLIPSPRTEEEGSERGKTKKQWLLAYLREHMQEVRPFVATM